MSITATKGSVSPIKARNGNQIGLSAASGPPLAVQCVNTWAIWRRVEAPSMFCACVSRNKVAPAKAPINWATVRARRAPKSRTSVSVRSMPSAAIIKPSDASVG